MTETEIIRIPYSYTFQELQIKSTRFINFIITYNNIRNQTAILNEETLRPYADLDFTNIKIENLSHTISLKNFQTTIFNYYHHTKEFHEIIFESIKNNDYVGLLWLNAIQNRRLRTIMDDVLILSSESSNTIFNWAISIYPLELEDDSVFHRMTRNIISLSSIEKLNSIYTDLKFRRFKVSYDVAYWSILENNLLTFSWAVSKKDFNIFNIFLESIYSNRSEFVRYLFNFHFPSIYPLLDDYQTEFIESLNYIYTNRLETLIDLIKFQFFEYILTLKSKDLLPFDF